MLSTLSASRPKSYSIEAVIDPRPSNSSKDCVIVSPIFSRMLILSVQISISCRPLCELLLVPLPELERIFTTSSSDSSPRPASSWIRRNASFSPGTKKPLTRRNRSIKLCPIPLEADRETPSVQNPIEKSTVPRRGRGSDGQSVKVYTSHTSFLLLKIHVASPG